MFICYGLFASNEDAPFYIGQTNNLSRRKNNHVQNCKNCKNENSNLYKHLRSTKDWFLKPLASCKNRAHAVHMESLLIDQWEPAFNVKDPRHEAWRLSDSHPYIPCDSHPCKNPCEVDDMTTTSIALAKAKGRTHDNIKKLIVAHKSELSKMGKINYKTSKVETKGGKQDTHYALLNSQQAHFIRL